MRYISGIFLLALLALGALYFYSKDKGTKSSWPTPEEWQQLKESVDGRLIKVESPFDKHDADPKAIDRLLQQLQNPFAIQEYPWGTQSTGWLNAWSTTASPYAVEADTPNDIIAAVQFARKFKMKLVIKGSGHDYLGRSNAPDSLLVWTHNMRDIAMHQAFIPAGAPSSTAGVPAVTIGAGARWIEVYREVTTNNGRYVQGGGCTTVGATGGFLQGGGFGSFSKKYGIAAASLLEAEVVTAGGELLIANEYQHPDLFWALKGGGGGTFGIVTKATLETHDLPNYFGSLQGQIKAFTDESFKELLEYFIHFYRDHLNNEHWGEQVIVKGDHSLDLRLVFQGLNRKEAEEVWSPFHRWITERSDRFKINSEFIVIPAEKLWDYDYLVQNFPKEIKAYASKNGNLFYWASNQNEVLAYWYTYQSRWLPISLFKREAAHDFAKTLFDASRSWDIELHFNKGLSGASDEALRRSKKTSINPIVQDAAALVILGTFAQNVIPGLPNHEPNIQEGIEKVQRINAAMKKFVDAAPQAGAYSNEADYFQRNWQQDFWGENYPKLLEIKKKYDPEGFFKCHHSIGSE